MNFNCKVFSFYHDFEFLIFIFYFPDFQRVMVVSDVLHVVCQAFFLQTCICDIA